MRLLGLLLICCIIQACNFDETTTIQEDFGSKIAAKVNLPVPVKQTTKRRNIIEEKVKPPKPKKTKSFKPITLPEEQLDSIFAIHGQFISDGFDFPVGKPDGRNYKKALNFGQRFHLGEDWNGLGGGNTDLGDPVYSIANGIVTSAENVCCGWGNIVRVIHKVPNSQEHDYVESVYAHLQNYMIQPGDFVRRGERIGSIGTGDGMYMAHLHLELRSFINMALGPGYSQDQFGFLDPSNFIRGNRPRR